MKDALRIAVVLVTCFLVGVSLSGCGGGDDNGNGGGGTNQPPVSVILAETDVTVGPTGGFANVSFTASNGNTVRITLEATIPSTIPYGYVQPPSGDGLYCPTQATAQNGVNVGELVITRTGSHTLTVYDGSNAGGTVHVEVERRP